MLCSWLTKGEALKGYFGPRIQSFLERSLTNQIPLRGRPILNIIVREFDLERSLGGMISSVELFQISSPEGDPTSLLALRDKIQYILGQLPDAEKPPDPMLSRWMFERLKKVRAMSMVMDRIRESPAGSPERTFDYLWSRLNRHLAELQHDKNLTSIQESLRKGPKTKTLGTPATSTDKGGKSKGKGKGDKGKSDNSKGKSKGKGSTSGGGSKPNDPGEPSKGESQGKGKGGTQESGGSKGPCVFFPKGLCRRGKDCPYSHDQPKPKPAAAAAKPKAAMVALVGALSCQPTAATAREVYQVEWALDSGAGEHLASLASLMDQGVPRDILEDCEVATASPLAFSTGGGVKESGKTLQTEGSVFGSNVVYMLQKCPFVKSLGQLVQSGFSFFWGPNNEPTLIPPDVEYQFVCDADKCVVADRVEHCVPIFKEEVSFVHGVPGTLPAHPSDGADRPAVEVIDDDVEVVHVVDEIVDLVESPKGDVVIPPSNMPESQPSVPLPPESAHGEEVLSAELPAPRADPPDDPMVIVRAKPIPVDHLICHQPFHPGCDICRQAKLRSHQHRRLKNQSEAKRRAQEVESPKSFLEQISCDHLEARDEGANDEGYALICIDKFSGAMYAYPSRNKNHDSVVKSLHHFCRSVKSIVSSDRAPQILSAIRELGLHPDPSAPNTELHNAVAESAIRTVRQGTRSLLLQSGLGLEHWPRAMSCFSFQFNLVTPPPDRSIALVASPDHDLPPVDEDPVDPEPTYDSKLHLALGYDPNVRLVPFGALVWYLSKEGFFTIRSPSCVCWSGSVAGIEV